MEEEVENIAVIKSAFSALESVALETGPKRHSSVRLIAQISGLAVFVFPLGKYVLFFPVMIKRGARSELASRLEAMLPSVDLFLMALSPLRRGRHSGKAGLWDQRKPDGLPVCRAGTAS
jgi:hypothetical protein